MGPGWKRFKTVDEILSTYDHLEIFKLAGFEINLNSKKLKNPLRVDRKGGCWFTYHNGIFFFNDFSPSFPYTHITCIKALMLAKQFKTSAQAVNYIMANLKPTGKVKDIKIVEKVQHKVRIETKSKEWTEEINPFKEIGVTIDNLKKENIELVSEYWLNSKMIPELTKNPFNDPDLYTTVCYNFESGNKQLYFPNKELDIRFINSCTSLDYFGLDFLENPTSDKLYWTSGGKDYLAARYGLGLNVIGNISENYNISFFLLQNIKKVFPNLYCFGDNDEPGKAAAAKKQANYGMIPIIIPDAEDIADAVKKKDKKELLCYLKQF